MKIAVTGHRPNKLGGYSVEAFSRLVQFASAVLRFYQPELVYTGMALGWDQAVAQACVDLNIPFIACVPFKEQESRWPEESQRRFRDLCAKAKEVVVVSGGEFSAAKMQVRNEYMVDHADGVVALWNGSSGGTGNCVRYAQNEGKDVRVVWQSWGRFQRK